MKDLFSARSDQYAKYRPDYPDALFKYIVSQLECTNRLWDCATGNGQVAFPMSEYFKEVYATDISANQLYNAKKAANIHYSMQPAEKTSFKDQFFDCITVAQAIHWFRFEDFYAEVLRVLKPGGFLGVFGYGLFTIPADKETEEMFTRFYTDVTGPYWDAERHYIDSQYATIPFPFTDISTPVFTIEKEWLLKDVLGYLSTWSAVKKYISVNNINPIIELEKKVSEKWQADLEKTIEFPLFVRMGQKPF